MKTHAEIIEEVHANIIKEWPTEVANDFFLTGLRDNDTMSKYHMDLGMYIRNKYELWAIPWTPVIVKFHGCDCDCSPYHPDNVSGTLIKEIWKRGLPNGNKSTN